MVSGQASWRARAEAGQGMGGIGVEPLEFRRRPDSVLPVPFFALGLVGFCALNLAVALAPAAVRWPLPPHGLLLLHLLILGWITPVMMGADYQLVPVVLHRPIAWPALVRVVVPLYVVGVVVFLVGWGTGATLWIAAGGVVAGCGLLLFCAHMLAALTGLRSRSPTALGLAGAVLFLILTAVLGPWMALGIGGVVGGAHTLRLKALHAVAGLGGWLLLTIMGATYQLLPFFAATPPSTPPRFGTTAVGLAGFGALLLLISALVPVLPGAIGMGAMAIGVALWLVDLGRMARHGRQARRESVVAYTLAAAAAIAVGGGLALACWGADRRLALAGAALALLVGPSLLILGQLQKILPFIAALDAALATKRRGTAPKTEALFPRGRAFLLLWPLAVGFAAEVVGIALGALLVLRLGALLVLLVALLYGGQQRQALAVWVRARGSSGGTGAT